MMLVLALVSCYFGTRGTRETIGTGARSGIRGRALVWVVAVQSIRDFAVVSFVPEVSFVSPVSNPK